MTRRNLNESWQPSDGADLKQAICECAQQTRLRRELLRERPKWYELAES
jgi:hypothetical protein